MREAPRQDIQALRALAVTMVVIYHLWPGALPGGYVGVDVFLVISGYLITRHLLQREGERLTDFWGRRIRRLVPAATGALVGTAVLALVFMPATSYAALTRAIGASAFAIENWNLIALSSDYLAADDDPSPVQHFWSLGVEEQFYLVWPMIIALCAWGVLARHRRRWIVVAVCALVLVSFSASVLLTGSGGAFAYFATVTRVWELGIGAALALAHSLVVGRGSQAARRWLWWGGAVAIAVAGFALSDVKNFPGYIAALPVLGTAAMIAANGDSLGYSGRRIYQARPLQWTGDRSYSIYLWHWPLIVALGAVVVNAAALAGAVLVATALLAAASKRWLEDVPRRSPRLNSSRRATAFLLVTCTALSLAAAGSVWAVQEYQDRRGQEMLAAAASNPCLGVAASRDANCSEQPVVMTAVQASHDKPQVYADGCWNSRPFTSRTTCTYGAVDGATKIALTGNSHAGQWQPALDAVASEEGWRLDTYLASECYTVDVELQFGSERLNENCLELQQWAVDSIIANEYDAVVVSNRTFERLAGVPKADQYEQQVAAYSRVLERFIDAGIAVLVIRDTPYPAHDIPQCLASKVSLDCTTQRAAALPPDPLADAALALGTAHLDASDLLCGPQACDPVIGGLIVNFDQGHFTRSLAETLAPEVSAALDSTLASGR